MDSLQLLSPWTCDDYIQTGVAPRRLYWMRVPMSDGKNEIEKLLHAYVAAVYAKDVNAYMALYDEHVRIFDMWEKWACEGAGEWRKSAEGWFNSLGAERVVVEADEINIQVADCLATLDGFVKFTAQSAE